MKLPNVLLFWPQARTLAAVLRDPDRNLPSFLSQPRSLPTLVRQIVLPWCAIRPAATLVRAAWMESWTAGIILALAGGLVGVGTWLGLALALPTVCRPFGLHLPERHAMTVSTVICAPLWGAGVILGVPDEPRLLFYLSRLLVLGLASYGIVLLRRMLRLLNVSDAALAPTMVAVSGAYLVIYLLNFSVMGITAGITVWLLEH